MAAAQRSSRSAGARALLFMVAVLVTFCAVTAQQAPAEVRCRRRQQNFEGVLCCDQRLNHELRCPIQDGEQLVISDYICRTVGALGGPPVEIGLMASSMIVENGRNVGIKCRYRETTGKFCNPFANGGDGNLCRSGTVITRIACQPPCGGENNKCTEVVTRKTEQTCKTRKHRTLTARCAGAPFGGDVVSSFSCSGNSKVTSSSLGSINDRIKEATCKFKKRKLGCTSSTNIVTTQCMPKACDARI